MPTTTRRTRRNAASNQALNSGSASSPTLKDRVDSSVIDAVAHMNGKSGAKAPDVVRAIQEKLIPQHEPVDQNSEQGTYHDVRSNISYTDIDAKRMRCVNRDVKWSKQSHDGGRVSLILDQMHY
jgi:hypothetical protein